jgi:hypothetical protein
MESATMLSTFLMAMAFQAPATTPPVQSAGNPEEIVCKTKKGSTSRVPLRLCAPRKQWDKRADESRDFIESARRPGTGGT